MKPAQAGATKRHPTRHSVLRWRLILEGCSTVPFPLLAGDGASSTIPRELNYTDSYNTIFINVQAIRAHKADKGT